MRLLLDTHILLWSLIEPHRLSALTTARVQNSDAILFSTASMWEISIKAGLKRAEFGVSPSRIFEEAILAGFNELQVKSSAALRVAALPHRHRDPFDRLLVAQAMDEPAILLTADTKLGVYSELVECV